MAKQRKNNTFETLFGDLLKTLQLIDGKELTPFQSELYENTLHSAIQAMAKKKNPCFVHNDLNPVGIVKKLDEKNPGFAPPIVDNE